MVGFGRYFQFALRVLPAVLMAAAGTCVSAEFPVTYESVAKGAIQFRYRATHAPFHPGKFISGHDAGLVGDGRTDNTETFRKLFANPGVNVQIDPGDYLTGRFVILGDTIVTLSPGVTIRDSGHLGPNEPLLQIYGNHVRIIGNGARIVENRADYTSDQGRHGVAIGQVSDVSIDGLESSDTGGDGFYISGPAGKPATNISLVNCVAHGNRRQGLSITNARHVDIINSTFTDTRGARPEFGVDLEPNRNSDFLDGILLYGVRTTANHGGGIVIYLDQLNLRSPSIDIEIVEHTSVGEETPFITNTAARSIAGAIRYVRVH